VTLPFAPAPADDALPKMAYVSSSRRRHVVRRTLLYLALALAALTFIYPFLWMASATFKPPLEIGSLSLIPQHPTLDNYRTMWARAPFGRALLNSTLVATTITLAVLVLGSMTAYAMARLRFRGGPVLNAATMMILLVPGQLTLIPLYTLMVQLGWIDTYAALIVPYLFNATAILMLRQFFLQIPQSLIDSARMDGMSEPRILFTIFWPLSKPVLSIVAIFTFMGSWNEVLWPLLVVRDEHLMTLPQLLTVFALGGGAGSVGVSLASAMVLVIPVVVAYVFLQRNFIESMAGTGVKG
jgi:multiple sugar transport system permease protein